MLTVLGCVIYEHDLRLVALSAVICFLGCFTTVSLMARASHRATDRPQRWPIAASIVFGCSVWSLHFVAMLAFAPADRTIYDLHLTALSALVASAGGFAAFRAWQCPIAKALRACLAGCLLGLAVTGMHYIGVAAMSVSSLVAYDTAEVAASIVISIAFSILAFARADHLDCLSRRLELCLWFGLAICGLHFTGMAAITMMPIAAPDTTGGVLGSATLAFAVGGVSVDILIASLVAVMVDQHMSLRTLKELGRMRLLGNLAQEVIIIHRDGIVLEVNKAGERMLKTPTANIVGQPIASFFSVESRAVLARQERTSAERLPEELEVQIVDGSRVIVELSCHPVDFLGRPATVLALRDLTDRKRDEARISHLARHDALTNLPNRYTLLERLDHALDGAARKKTALAVVFVDLDRFKFVNDTHGHAAGDDLLMQVSRRIRFELQPGDLLARIGGDEFVLVLTAITQPEQVSAVATRIVDAMRRPFLIEGQSIEIGASAGIALYPDDGATPDTLMRAADIAMYRVKEEGRGAIRFYEASMNAQLQARLQLQAELAVAVERNELVLHYQPIVNGQTGELEILEALIRWYHPRHGMVSPADFIPLAEQTGLIDQIGTWVIETACRQAASWDRPWRVAINVSPKQFHKSNVCEAIGRSLTAHALDPARLVVEVTEGILIEDTANAVVTLNRLREIGVRVALDDFGTGYSSLSYLQLFKFDKLKIDQAFVRKLGESEDALTLTRSIVNLGHNLGLQVTAEGVETSVQLAILQQLGCDQIQGYLVARPALIGSYDDCERHRVHILFAGEQPPPPSRTPELTAVA